LTYAAANWGHHLRGKAEEAAEAKALALSFVANAPKVACSDQVSYTGGDARRSDGWSKHFPTGRGPVQVAASFGLVRIVGALVERSADINSRDSTGTTALHGAAGHGYDDVVLLLLREGADLDAATEDGDTALSVAAVARHTATAHLLLDAGGDLEVRDAYRGTALHTAAYNSDVNLMELLLSRNADVNARDETHDNTALHVAAHFGNDAMMELLLRKGAEISHRNKYGCSPLHYAAYGGYETAVATLLQHDAEVDSKDKRGSTPLHMAAEGVGGGAGCKQVVRSLLNSGADPRAVSEVGWQASGGSEDESADSLVASFLFNEAQGAYLHQMVTGMPMMRRSHANKLFGSGAFIQTQSMERCSFTFPTMSYGGTPLNRAAFRGNADAARLLLNGGGCRDGRPVASGRVWP